MSARSLYELGILFRPNLISLIDSNIATSNHWRIEKKLFFRDLAWTIAIADRTCFRWFRAQASRWTREREKINYWSAHTKTLENIIFRNQLWLFFREERQLIQQNTIGDVMNIRKKNRLKFAFFFASSASVTSMWMTPAHIFPNTHSILIDVVLDRAWVVPSAPERARCYDWWYNVLKWAPHRKLPSSLIGQV